MGCIDGGVRRDISDATMAAKPIPEGFRTITPQLALNDCAKAIDFYKKAFAAEEVSPRNLDPSGTKVMHCHMRIGDSAIFVNDVFPGMGGTPSNSELWLYVNDCDAWVKRAVQAGATEAMPCTDVFWGDRMGVITDPFGQRWTIATHVKDLTPEEIKKGEEAFLASMKK